MAFEAYFVDDRGLAIVPQDRDDWRDWVSAGKTRNWCIDDPLLDWLDLYGDDRGFERDPDGDPRTDFRAFLFRQGNAFEAAVVSHLERTEPVRRLTGGLPWLHSFDACIQTFEAMKRGDATIHQGLVRNPATRTYGCPDLLVRSDVLHRLFPDAISEVDSQIGAPGLGLARCHYRVVDIKYTGLKLNLQWQAANDHLPYMVQTFLYNEALGRIQGYTPDHAYLLGRGWGKGIHELGSTSCLDRLAPVSREREVRHEPLLTMAGKAVAWVRRARGEGDAWDPRSQGCPLELRPNPKNSQNQPWHRAVAEIASTNEDVMLAWQVGLPGREAARAEGVLRWTDPRFSAAVARVKPAFQAPLDRMLAINRDPLGPALEPARMRVEAEVWARAKAVEFYVDFETVSSLNDDFERIPEQNGQPLIFMIGCGHIENGAWQFSCFVAGDLTVASEAQIVETWLAHMEAARLRLAPRLSRPLVFHWSPAETSTLSTALDSARRRSPERASAWREPNWFDFLTRVMKREPVIVRGPMGFGLKTVARSLKRHGLIETEWQNGVTDGLGAMVAAWWCEREAQKLGCRLSDFDLMDEVRRYNEVDCKVMMEAVACLRERAVQSHRAQPARRAASECPAAVLSSGNSPLGGW